MKRHTHIALQLLALILLSGCQISSDRLSSAVVIDLATDEGKQIAQQEIILSVDTLLTLCNETLAMADIRDICLTDSSVYLLDGAGTIACFARSSGELVRSINRHGRGRGEYLSAKSLVVDGGFIYVLDLECFAVLSCDLDLNYVGKISIGFPALDFAKVSDGFLFYNLAATEKTKRFVHTNMQGEIVQSFLAPTAEVDFMLSEKVFTYGEENEVYCAEPMKYTLYTWSDNQLVEAFVYTGMGGVEDVDAFSVRFESQGGGIIRSFVTSRYVVTQFLAESMVRHQFYDRMSGETLTGSVALDSNRPFFPIKSFGSSLVGIHEVPIDGSLEKTEVMLVRFRL